MPSLNSCQLQCWPTPILVRDLSTQPRWEERNSRLLELVTEKEKSESSPLTFGVVEATKTSKDIFQWQDDNVDWLRSEVRLGVDELMSHLNLDSGTMTPTRVFSEGWVVIYRKAASHRLHTHHGSAWSGVYYLQTGQREAGGGHLQFLDPRPAAIARGIQPNSLYVQPTPGKIVFFPSWLPHSVKSTGDLDKARVCVAFNVTFEEAS